MYCDFSIAVRSPVPSELFVKTVCTERDARAAQEPWESAQLETLYLGGGTPSLLAPRSLALLVERLAPGRGEGAEITLEANPDDVSSESAAAWVAAGVNRVSLGAQSFEPRVLEWMHRTHAADASGRAVEVLRAAGVESVSLDLIFALPEALERDFEAELERALELEPDHLSVYGLTTEPGTAWGRWVAGGSSRPAPDERYAEEFLRTHELLTAAGFDHYEISNYARPGRRSRHNGVYWQGRPYVGLGPSAHSYVAGERSWNVSAWAAYERAVGEVGVALAGSERLSEAQRSLEGLYLGLRTAEGVPAAELDALATRVVEGARGAGWLEVAAGRARLTPPGWLRIDEIVTA